MSDILKNTPGRPILLTFSGAYFRLKSLKKSQLFHCTGLLPQSELVYLDAKSVTSLPQILV